MLSARPPPSSSHALPPPPNPKARTTLAATGATCLITSELLSTSTERALQPEEYLAEGVILLRTQKKGLRTIQILKMRGSKVDIKPRPYAIRDNGIEVLATEEVYEQP